MSNGSDSNGNYRVAGLTMRQQAALDQNGKPITVMIVSFNIGPHGPFQIMFPPARATPENVRDAVLSEVNRLRQQDALIDQINSAQ